MIKFKLRLTLISSAWLILGMLGSARADPVCRTGLDQPCAKPVKTVRLGKPAQKVEGILVDGTGSDIPIVTIRRDDGTQVRAWCSRVCETWSELTPDGNEERIKKAYLGTRVLATVARERNNGRVPGDGDAEELLFVKTISLVR